MNLKQFSLKPLSLKRLTYATIAISLLGSAILAQDGRGTASATVKGAAIKIDYGRPSLKGRDMLSQLSDGQVWRLGMNQATQIDSSKDLVVAGKPVAAGKYTLWLKKSGGAWLLCFHPKTGVWGAPPLTEGFIAELPLKSEKVSDSTEQLNIALADSKGKAAIKIQWGKDVLSGAFDVK
ncbi:MAG TPA: DUF2911 domain-containing protein [Blastocatellia bacterium]|nr:DUF2911 domain-containing protein [Blastocatellia bacterium]